MAVTGCDGRARDPAQGVRYGLRIWCGQARQRVCQGIGHPRDVVSAYDASVKLRLVQRNLLEDAVDPCARGAASGCGQERSKAVAGDGNCCAFVLRCAPRSYGHQHAQGFPRGEVGGVSSDGFEAVEVSIVDLVCEPCCWGPVDEQDCPDTPRGCVTGDVEGLGRALVERVLPGECSPCALKEDKESFQGRPETGD